MLGGRRLASLFRIRSSSAAQLSSTAKTADEGESGSVVRKAVSFVGITVTGGLLLSCLDDVAIYYACSSKAMEKASSNLEIKGAIGEPIVKGPWYNATLGVTHRRQSLSCKFPVSGPRGCGVFHLKAVRNEDANWFSSFLPRGWEILVMEALVHVPTNEEKQQTMRIDLTPPACSACTDCKPPESEKPKEK